MVEILLLSTLLFVSFSVAASDNESNDSFFGAKKLDIDEFIGDFEGVDTRVVKLEERVKTLERQLLRMAEGVSLLKRVAVKTCKDVIQMRNERKQLISQLQCKFEKLDQISGTHLRQIARNRELSVQNQSRLDDICVRLSPAMKVIV